MIAPTAFAAEPGESAAPTTAPDDLSSIDGIVGALYDVVSGPADEPRDWDRFRSLLLPGARLIPSGGDDQNGYQPLVRTPEEYVERATAFFAENGFFETELHRVEERFGPVAHAFSTYESRHTRDGAPFARGLNSIQLFWDGSRWWVANIAWFNESPDHPIPERYLPH